MLLRTLYKWFPESFHKLVFESQRKPQNFDKLELAFVDSNGKRYFKYMSDFDIPLTRKGMMELKLKEFSMGLTGDEVGMICDAMDKALSRQVRGAMSPDIGMIGHLITEIRNRKENLIHPEIMMSMVSYMYIREDERPEVVDEEVHQQKVEQFTKDSEGGLRDFFITAGLNKFLPFLEQSNNDLDQIMEMQKARLKALKIQLDAYSTEKK